MSPGPAAGPALVLGTFPAERAWTPAEQARLPGLAGLRPSAVVGGMDQLLGPLCRADDVLLTRQALHPALREHLASAGLAPRLQDALYGWDAALDERASASSVGELWLRRNEADPTRALPARPRALRPYAVDEWTGELCRRLDLHPVPPGLDVVREANSKVFSTRLANELGVGHGGVPVGSTAELLRAADGLIDAGPVVVKEEHGVSGNGSVIVTDRRRLERVRGHLEAQEREGRQVSAVVEPLLGKRGDFSCHLEIAPGGGFRVLGLQVTVNRGFNYSASLTMAAGAQKELLDSAYGRTMEAVAARLSGLGYHGYACVDSLRLEPEGVAPILEINARMSMGLINHHLGAYFARFGMGSLLTYLPVSSEAPVDVERVLGALDAAGQLFTPSRPQGIVPLASATLPFIPPPDHEEGEPLRGRLYFAAGVLPGTTPESVVAPVGRVLAGLGIQTPNPR